MKHDDHNQALCDEFGMDPVCGANAPLGWIPRLHKLCTDLKATGLDLSKVSQIKSKFGGLRFYVDVPQTDEQRELIWCAEAQSFSLCTVCGEPGEPTFYGKAPFLSQDTLCPNCAKECHVKR